MLSSNSDVIIDEAMLFKLKYKNHIPFVISPIKDHLEPQSHEDWFCPLCLQEDTHGQEQYAPPLSPHYLDEWGCSASSSWLLHPTHTTQTENFASSSFSSRRLLDALSVLASSQKSYLVPIVDPTSIPTLQKNPNSIWSSSSQRLSGVLPWSFQDRMSVLTGLCEVLKGSQGAADMFLKVNSDCQKLWTISSKSSFREADFMKVVKEIAGEEGMTLCRSLLDGIEDDGDRDLQGRVTEGRCTGDTHVHMFIFH